MKTLRLYWTRTTITCLAGALLLVACGGSDETGDESTDQATEPAAESDAGDDGLAEPQSITMVLPFGYLVGFAPSLVAESAGYFDEYGLDVAIETASGSSQAVQQVLGGQALVSRTGGPDHISAVANTGAPLISIGTVSQRSPFEVISSGANPIESPEDFAGQTIGVVSAGGATEHLLRIMLIEAGIDMDEVTMEVVGNAPSAFSLVESGDIAAYIATSGTRSNLEYMDADVHFFTTDDYAPIPGQAYVVDANSVDENAEILEAFLRGVEDALVFMLEEDEDFEQTLEYLSEWDIAALQDVEQARYELEVQSRDWLAEDGTILLNVPEAWQDAQDLMVGAGVLEEAVPGEQLYTNEFVERVLD